MQQLLQRLSNVEIAVNSATSAVNTVTSAVDTVKSEVSTVKSEVSTVKSAVSTVKSEVSKVDKKVSYNIEQNSSNSVKIDRISERMNSDLQGYSIVKTHSFNG